MKIYHRMKHQFSDAESFLIYIEVNGMKRIDWKVYFTVHYVNQLVACHLVFSIKTLNFYYGNFLLPKGTYKWVVQNRRRSTEKKQTNSTTKYFCSKMFFGFSFQRSFAYIIELRKKWNIYEHLVCLHNFECLLLFSTTQMNV